MGLKRLALHAGILHIEYQGNTLEIHSPLPQDLSTVFENMPWWNTALLTQPSLGLPSLTNISDELRSKYLLVPARVKQGSGKSSNKVWCAPPQYHW